MSLLAIVGCAGCAVGDRIRPGQYAVLLLVRVQEAEVLYRERFGRYGELTQLESADLLDPDKVHRWQAGARGYSFRFRITAESYALEATARDPCDDSYRADQPGSVETLKGLRRQPGDMPGACKASP